MEKFLKLHPLASLSLIMNKNSDLEDVVNYYELLKIMDDMSTLKYEHIVLIWAIPLF